MSDATFIGAAISIGLCALGTGLAQGHIGSAIAGLIAEKPEEKGLALVLLAIPETLVVLGFVIAIMMMFGIAGG
ncbi:MAG: ATPase [Candidatus Thorarchaeota archaeon]